MSRDHESERLVPAPSGAVRALRGLVAPLTRTRAFRAVAPAALPPVERVLSRVTRGRRSPVRARLLGDDERDAAWDRIQAQWPGYRAYERDSGRVVRLFRLEPVPPPAL